MRKASQERAVSLCRILGEKPHVGRGTIKPPEYFGLTVDRVTIKLSRILFIGAVSHRRMNTVIPFTIATPLKSRVNLLRTATSDCVTKPTFATVLTELCRNLFPIHLTRYRGAS